MASSSTLVYPQHPTALHGAEHVDLPGYDLWMFTLDHVHVIEGHVNEAQFQEAVSSCLRIYPHAAGRLREEQGHWMIKLTNSGVPVHFDDQKHLSRVPDSIIKGTQVVQDDISSLLSAPSGQTEVNNDVPLVRFKVTLYGKETCIGISWHHTLGDLVVFHRFTHTLSQLYQQLPPVAPLPNFEKHHFSKPSAEQMQKYLPLVPQLHAVLPITEVFAKYMAALQSMERLEWRFERREVLKLQSAIKAQGGIPAAKASTQDCLNAYMISLVNRCSKTPLHRFTSAANYRYFDVPFADPDVAGNPIQNVVTDNLPLKMADIVISLRKSLEGTRDSKYLAEYMSVVSQLMYDAATAGLSIFFAPREGVMTANSTAAIDWQSAHFGYPNGSRMYTVGWMTMYLRTSKSNPELQSDGSWKQTDGAVDAWLGVHEKLRSAMLEMIRNDLDHPDFPHNLPL